MSKSKNNEQLKKIEEERDEFKNKYLRALADYQNFERRVVDERQALMKSGTRSTLVRLMPFLDNLEQAEVFVKDKGLKMIKDQFAGFLKEEGLEELEVLNKEYDPYLAEAIDVVQGEKDDIVVEVVRKGYKLGDQIIRPAQVKVSKKVTSKK